jgi:hypothetical protein
LGKKPPAKNCKLGQKSVPEEFVAARKKNDGNKDDGILLSSDDDEARNNVVGRSSSEAPAATMPKEAMEFFSIPWKDNVSVYAHVY